MITNPLVSIIVITYNSSKYVLDTLDSIKGQTYENIELIISDDCSKDNTVDICKNWIDKNCNRFIRTEILASSKNTGTSANFNRGLAATCGELLKFIAGDDILLNDCIGQNLEFFNKNNYKLIFSRSNVFEERVSNVKKVRPGNNFQLPPLLKDQLNLILKADFVNSPTCFIESKTIRELGGFDERFPFMEDYPMWLKFLKNGHAIGYFPVATVMYRMHGNSLSNFSKNKVNEKWLDSQIEFFHLCLKMDLLRNYFFWTFFYKSLNFSIVRIINKTNSKFAIFILKSFLKPFFLLNKIL